jgi:hypothetical protein
MQGCLLVILVASVVSFAADLVTGLAGTMPATCVARRKTFEKTISRKTIWVLDYARFENKRKLIVQLFASFMLFLDYIESAQKG